MNHIIKTINQTLTFILEIAMFIAYGCYGMSRSWDFAFRFLLTIFIISVAITLWSILAAPKSRRRLSMPYLAISRAGMFLIAVFFLFQMEHKNIGIVMTLVIVVTQTVSYFTEK